MPTRFPSTRGCASSIPVTGARAASAGILSRYDDVFTAAQQWETYSSAQGNLVDEIPTRPGATLGTTDPPRHDRLRALTQAAFTKRNLEYLVAPTIEIARRALDRTGVQGRFDFVADYANEITVGILFLMLGLPPPDRAEIRRKVVLSVSTDKAIRGRNAEHDRAFREIGDFIAAEVAVRRGRVPRTISSRAWRRPRSTATSCRSARWSSPPRCSSSPASSRCRAS